MAAEKNIENAIRKNITKLPHAVCYKNYSNDHTGAGRPDLSGVYQGKAFCVEVKRADHGNFKENQLTHLLSFADAGGISILTCLSNVNAVLKNPAKFAHKITELEHLSAKQIWDQYYPLLVILN